MENIDNFQEIMDKFKKTLNIKSDSEIAEKLDISRQNYSDRKKRNSIPYEEIIKLCKKEKINIDNILNNKDYIYNNIRYKEELYKIIDKLNEKELEYYYHIIKAQIIKKEI
ncbi:hypothetical protein CRU98_10100 [Arcobacter sp. CECT 8986]|uniref:helix-turn-helix domain-containing protein n=1 Tax=Arcobacter sp. CECT 8986 TaxID=2044507 RepID=UPI001009B5D4|nr:helix-turn-helix domain-containing protein [Arcobacter sp. CECT 8986]RXJ98381.1 hypothetical protein CRU98_10100 [Arcobacter sp. CECT 8986]